MSSLDSSQFIWIKPKTFFIGLKERALKWHHACFKIFLHHPPFSCNNTWRYVATLNVHVIASGDFAMAMSWKHGRVLRWHVPTACTPFSNTTPSSPLPTSYRFTTRQMAVIWEVLRWAHFIALLMHSHKQPPPLFSFSLPPSPLALYSPFFFLPVCRLPWINLYSSLSVSQHPILFLSRREQMCPPTHTLTVSHWSQTQAL